jgi:hypothetical protein
MDLFGARKTGGLDRHDVAVLVAYLAALAWGICHHVQCMDEAQAWLIARDSGLRELLFRRLHYEGAPALWPLALWVLARVHLPYGSINWLGGAFAATGVFLLLRYAPFPRAIRWLLPFTFFLQYQYAVIARPYVLYAALIFALCIIWTATPARPVLFALIAGLLANVSLHGAVFACLLAAMYAFDLRRAASGGAAIDRRRVSSAAGLFALLLLLAAAVAFPAPDGSFGMTRDATSKGKVHALLLRLMPEQPAPAVIGPLDPPLPSAGIERQQAQPAPNQPILERFINYVVPCAVLTMNAATYPIARSNLLAEIFLVCWAAWLWSRGWERFAALYFTGIFLCAQVWIYSHHSGLFLLYIVASAWIALKIPKRSRGPRWIGPAFMAASLVIILLQIGWTAYCLHAEAQRPYDPGRATERLLASQFPAGRIAGYGFETISTQPYSDRNLYFNWPHTYYLWSADNMVDRRRTAAVAAHPAAVVAAEYIEGKEDMLNQWLTIAPPGRVQHTQMIQFWQQQGYRETHRFCGERFMRMGVANTVCEVVMEPVAP